MPKEQLYIKYEGDKPVAYAYGEEWVAMALFMDDLGYPDEETARAAWASKHVDKVVGKEQK